MVTFKPFKALRPKDNGLASMIASFPYDVVNSAEAKVIAGDNGLSFLHVVKPEIDLPESTNPYAPEIYAKAGENFRKLIDGGFMAMDEEGSFYVYREVGNEAMGRNTQTGVVGCASADDYWADRIKKHEFTLKKKEDDRIRHTEAINANAGPVFLFSPRNAELDEAVGRVTGGQPVYDFTSTDGVRHTVWKVHDSADNERIAGIFSRIPATYIADGHHRAATGALVAKRRKEANPAHTGSEEYNFFLAVVFPGDDLNIMEYNRLVKDLNGMTPDEFIELVAEKFEIEDGYEEKKPFAPHTISMYLDGEWFLLMPKQGTFNPNDPIKSLDVSILMENLLSPILAIGDPRTDGRIDFVGGIRGVGELERRVDSGEMAAAFAMFPTSIEELQAVADAGLCMPPKSTWFEPKLRSGLLVHRYG
ncbi:MAG: DUF1015 domain-containing protein [Thermoplasmata archaeon HGW-Thermoplasmata-1]|nr:MAG: DUF1015 domain-containing protein [Thermoplasmata archaeon HGW-Thermoplasmata-1]